MGNMWKNYKASFLEWRGYLFGIGLVVIITLIKYLGQPSIISPGKAVLYVLAIVPTAILFGFGPAILATILSLLSYDFFFVPPLHSLGTTDTQEIDFWIVFLLVGVIISYLSANLRNKNQIAAAQIQTRKEAEAKLVKYQGNLEDLVNQRTFDLEKANLDLKQEINERKQVEEKLKENELRFRTMADYTYDWEYWARPDGSFEYISPSCESVTGYRREEFINHPELLTEIIYPEDKPSTLHHIKEEHEHATSIDYRIITRSGETRWIAHRCQPIITPEGRRLGQRVSNRDITQRIKAEEALADAKADLEIKVKERTLELTQANEQLKLYNRRITEVQEEERKQIAYELHDDTSQYLAILKLQLDSLIQSGEIESPEIIEKLEYLEKDATRAVENIRRFSHELRPTILEHLGLRAALEQIVEDMNKLKQMTVEVTSEGTEPDLSEEIKLGFFRIAQEALNNCRKHAQASNVIVNLKFQEGYMEMTVSDDGIGFNVQEAAIRSGHEGSLGLTSMQERAKLIEANFRIESRPEHGTVISVYKAIRER